jgi:hypothetical protein
LNAALRGGSCRGGGMWWHVMGLTGELMAW